MPRDFSAGKAGRGSLTMVSDFLEKNGLPSSGYDGATFWVSELPVAERLAGTEGRIDETRSPFGTLYTVNYDHIKGRHARGLRHNLNRRLAQRDGTVLFIKGFIGKWYRVVARGGHLELMDTTIM